MFKIIRILRIRQIGIAKHLNNIISIRNSFVIFLISRQIVQKISLCFTHISVMVVFVVGYSVGLALCWIG